MPIWQPPEVNVDTHGFMETTSTPPKTFLTLHRPAAGQPNDDKIRWTYVGGPGTKKQWPDKFTMKFPPTAPPALTGVTWSSVATGFSTTTSGITATGKRFHAKATSGGTTYHVYLVVNGDEKTLTWYTNGAFSYLPPVTLNFSKSETAPTGTGWKWAGDAPS